MSKRICFLVYEDWEEALLGCDDKTFRELITSIFKYGFRKEETELSPLAKMMMKLIKPALKRDWERYEKRASQNKINGISGGRPKKEANAQQEEQNPIGYEKTHSVIENPLGFTETQSVIKNPMALINKKQDNINKKQDTRNEKEELLIDNKSSLASSIENAEPKIDFKSIMDFYNRMMQGKRIRKMIAMPEHRKQAIHARVNKYGIDAVYEMITKAANSDFLNGNNSKNWSPSVDWLFGVKNFVKVLEGNYDNETHSNYGTNRNDNYERAIRTGAETIAQLFDESE